MVEYISAVGTEALAKTFESSAPSGTTTFGEWLSQHVSALNDQVVSADTEVRRLALGETGNLHEVMMRLESTKLSFELAVQVRNKLLEAYQDVMRMQI